MKTKILTEKALTKAQLDDFKKEYENVFAISVPLNPRPFTDYSNKTMSALRALCVERKIATGNNSTKQSLAELLEDDDTEANEKTEQITGYFRRPTITEISIATQGNKDNSLKAAEVMYNTSLLGGHPLFDTDEDVKSAAMKQFKTIVATRQATIKKL